MPLQFCKIVVVKKTKIYVKKFFTYSVNLTLFEKFGFIFKFFSTAREIIKLFRLRSKILFMMS